MSDKEKPWSIYALMTLLLTLGLGGIGGGITLLADPGGGALGLPEGLLDSLFIADYFWPGVFLILVMGLAPYLVYYGVWKGLPWARAGVISQGMILVGWILFQFALWGDPIFIQILYLAWGLALIGLVLLKPSRDYFD